MVFSFTPVPLLYHSLQHCLLIKNVIGWFGLASDSQTQIMRKREVETKNAKTLKLTTRKIKRVIKTDEKKL